MPRFKEVVDVSKNYCTSPWSIAGFIELLSCTFHKVLHVSQASQWRSCWNSLYSYVSLFEPETLGLCVCPSMEKEQQRLSLEGCGAAGASETKAAPKCSSNAQLTNEQTVGIIFMSWPCFALRRCVAQSAKAAWISVRGTRAQESYCENMYFRMTSKWCTVM